MLPAFLVLAFHAQAPPPATSASDAFAEKVGPFLAAHCNECHSGAKPKGDLDLDVFRDLASTDGRSNTWFDVRERLSKGEMPPKKRARPTRGEIDAVVGWIDTRFAHEARASETGRPALRRLNRVEYTNTIRDLLGVDFDAAAEFPSDDVGYGFDNIGDVLSMPDLLLEKYVAAAEKIAARAVIVEDPAHPPVQHVDGNKLSGGRQSSAHGKARSVFAPGDTGFDARLPREGEYVLRARVWGDQAGNEPVKVALRFGTDEKGRFEVPALAAAPQIVEVRFRADVGKRKVTIAFLNDYYMPDDPDPKNRDRNLIVEWLELAGPLDPPPLSEFQRQKLDPKTRGSQRDVIAKLARRAWRRPVASDEVDRLLALAKSEKTFEGGVRFALQAILVSPHFLFLVESDAEGADGPRQVTDHELATRLAYFLWSSMPDSELSALADAKKLSDPKVLATQVQRMLRDGRSSALSRNFASQWLQTRNLDHATPNPEQFLDFDEGLKAAMRAESEMFFDAILREARSVLEFLDSDFTFVNERLAKHYGLPGVRGGEMRRVRIERGERGGVLGQAAVLTVTSNPTRTSPVKRGKWILENLLLSPTPPPPPGVGVIDESAAAAQAASLRERMEEHRKNTDCAGCHARLDPLGLGLENFDAIGAWRTGDAGHAIDATGDLPDGRRFAGPAELKALLAADDAFARCLAKKLATYALGRGLAKADEAAIDALVAKLGKGPTLEALIHGLVGLELFRTRIADRKSGG